MFSCKFKRYSILNSRQLLLVEAASGVTPAIQGLNICSGVITSKILGGGVITPRILGDVFTPRILGGVNNPNNHPYIRHWLYVDVPWTFPIGSCEAPHKIWARSVRPLWCLLDANGQTDKLTNRQTDKKSIYICCINYCFRIGCDFPMWMQYSLVGYMFSFLVLFSDFYYKV